MLCSGGTIEHAVAVRSPLDVAQPAGSVGEALQVGVEGDRIIAGITWEEVCLMMTAAAGICFGSEPIP